MLILIALLHLIQTLLLKRIFIDFIQGRSSLTPPEVLKVDFMNCLIGLKISVISILMVLKWATEFRQPSPTDAGLQLFGCLLQQASSMRSFTLTCLPWMSSEDLKKNAHAVRLIF